MKRRHITDVEEWTAKRQRSNSASNPVISLDVMQYHLMGFLDFHDQKSLQQVYYKLRRTRYDGRKGTPPHPRYITDMTVHESTGSMNMRLFPNLERLAIRQGSRLIHLRETKSLTTVDIHGNTDRFLMMHLTYLPSLTSLNVNNCNVQGIGLMGKWKSLHTLYANCPYGDDFEKIKPLMDDDLESFSHVKEFHIGSNNQITNVGMLYLTGATVLDVSDCAKITQLPFGQMTQLRHLNISHGAISFDLIEELPCLEHLTLSVSNRLTDKVALAIASIPTLQTVTILPFGTNAGRVKFKKLTWDGFLELWSPVIRGLCEKHNCSTKLAKKKLLKRFIFQTIY